jgi:hypothetical protein
MLGCLNQKRKGELYDKGKDFIGYDVCAFFVPYVRRLRKRRTRAAG